MSKPASRNKYQVDLHTSTVRRITPGEAGMSFASARADLAAALRDTGATEEQIREVRRLRPNHLERT